MESHTDRIASPRPPTEEHQLKQMSQHIIRLLEHRIQKDFGLRVICGAELEFSLIPSDAYLRDTTGTINKGANPLGTTENRNLHHWPQGVHGENIKATPVPKGTSLPDPNAAVSRLFAHSPYISHFQAEHKPFVYEVALSHKSNHNSPQAIARALEATRSTIARNWKKTCAALGVREIIGVSFDAKTDAIERLDAVKQQLGPRHAFKLPVNLLCEQLAPTQALQINFSLINNQGKRPLNATRNITNLEEAMLPVLREGILFSAPNATSYARLNARSSVSQYTRHPKSFMVHSTGGATGAALLRRNTNTAVYDSYIENRIPGADADPSMVMAITLLALYDGLRQCADPSGRLNPDVDIPPLPHDQEAMPTDKAEAVQWLAQGTHIRSLLNQMEPTLGDRYCDLALHFLSENDLTPITAQQSRGR